MLTLGTLVLLISTSTLVSSRAVVVGGGEGTPCSRNQLGTFAPHPKFCNRYLVCNQKQDDRGRIIYIYDIQTCAQGLVWVQASTACDRGDCKNIDNSNLAVAECTAGGDPHYKSFDNGWLHFQGGCTYVLSRFNSRLCLQYPTYSDEDDYRDPDSDPTDNFEIRVKNYHLQGNTQFSYVKYLLVIYKGYIFKLDPQDGDNVQVNGTTIDYEDLEARVSSVKIYRLYGWLTLCLDNGVVIAVRKFAQATVKVPYYFAGCLEGFCGNYNGRYEDDFTTPSGRVLPHKASSYNAFGTAWQVIDEEDPDCVGPTGDPLPICDGIDDWKEECENALSANNTGNAFSRCPSHESEAPGYVASCQTDICPFKEEDDLIKESICEFVRSAFRGCVSFDLDFDKMPPYCKKCNSGPCLNNATCVEKRASFRCECAPGFTGKYCETDINECNAYGHGCDHLCVNTFGSYECRCRDGYARNSSNNPPTCEDIDECATDQHSCAQECINTEGSYSCDCRPGFSLNSDGKTCDDIDECTNTQTLCPQVCTNTQGSYSCGCRPGYTLNSDGITCNDTDECKNNPPPCLQECTNTDGSYLCGCRPGYTLDAFDGKTCNDIDECTITPIPCPQVCTNTQGSYLCGCQPGYTLDASDGKTCNDIDECTNIPPPCLQECTNTDGSYLCDCQPGYTLDSDGKTCKDIDECAAGVENNCNQTCVNNVGSYECDCVPGYTLNSDGKSCDLIDPCSPNPCSNGGTCSAQQTTTGLSYICTCPPTWSGLQCEIYVDPCTFNQCANGATCISEEEIYYCNCTDDWTGRFCETPVDPCEANPCLNGGTCSPVQTPNGLSYTCACTDNWSGPICDVPEPCKPNPCNNGGNCEEVGRTYACDCLPNWSGRHCDTYNDPCDPNPCHNAGTCDVLSGIAVCECPPGYEGDRCQNDKDECVLGTHNCQQNCSNTIGSFVCRCQRGYTLNADLYSCDPVNPCSPNPCNNGGSCVPVGVNHRCNCPPLWSGGNCSTFVDPCRPNPCSHGGNCSIANNGAFCDCPAPYAGDRCEETIDQCSCQNGGTCRTDGTCACPTNFVGLKCEKLCQPGSEDDECVCAPCDYGDISLESTASGYIRDRYDCSRYYQCVRNMINGRLVYTKILRQCPGGLLYNPSIKNCAWPFQTSCVAEQRPTNLTTTEPNSTPTPTSAPEDNSCGFSMRRHPRNCYQFQQCGSGRIHDICCPARTVFDESSRACAYVNADEFNYDLCDEGPCSNEGKDTPRWCQYTECCYRFDRSWEFKDASSHGAHTGQNPWQSFHLDFDTDASGKEEGGAFFNGNQLLENHRFSGLFTWNKPTAFTIDVKFRFRGGGPDQQGLVVNENCHYKATFGMVLVTEGGHKYVECFINDRQSGSIRSTVKVEAGKKYRATFVYYSVAPAYMKLKVNGDEVQSPISQGPVNGNYAALYLGFDGCPGKDVKLFNGVMYNARVYRQAREFVHYGTSGRNTA